MEFLANGNMNHESKAARGYNQDLRRLYQVRQLKQKPVEKLARSIELLMKFNLAIFLGTRFLTIREAYYLIYYSV